MQDIEAKLKQIPRVSWQGIYYHPISPRPDNEELAALGRRLMLVHGGSGTITSKTQLLFVDKNIVCSGWCVGITD